MSQCKFALLALPLLLAAACTAQPTHKDPQPKTNTANARRVRCVTVPPSVVAGSYIQTMAHTNYSGCNGSSDDMH
jgi:hypothetical protein